MANEKLIELLLDMPFGNSTEEAEERHASDTADYLVDNGVTIPVYCKDCKWCDDFDVNGIALCWENKKYVNGDDFCSDGERREGECT